MGRAQDEDEYVSKRGAWRLVIKHCNLKCKKSQAAIFTQLTVHRPKKVNSKLPPTQKHLHDLSKNTTTIYMYI